MAKNRTQCYRRAMDRPAITWRPSRERRQHITWQPPGRAVGRKMRSGGPQHHRPQIPARVTSVGRLRTTPMPDRHNRRRHCRRLHLRCSNRSNRSPSSKCSRRRNRWCIRNTKLISPRRTWLQSSQWPRNPRSTNWWGRTNSRRRFQGRQSWRWREHPSPNTASHNTGKGGGTRGRGRTLIILHSTGEGGDTGRRGGTLKCMYICIILMRREAMFSCISFKSEGFSGHVRVQNPGMIIGVVLTESLGGTGGPEA